MRSIRDVLTARDLLEGEGTDVAVGGGGACSLLEVLRGV